MPSELEFHDPSHWAKKALEGNAEALQCVVRHAQTVVCISMERKLRAAEHATCQAERANKAILAWAMNPQGDPADDATVDFRGELLAARKKIKKQMLEEDKEWRRELRKEIEALYARAKKRRDLIELSVAEAARQAWKRRYSSLEVVVAACSARAAGQGKLDIDLIHQFVRPEYEWGTGKTVFRALNRVARHPTGHLPLEYNPLVGESGRNAPLP